MTAELKVAGQDTFPYAYSPKHLEVALAEIRRGPLPTELDGSFFTRAGLQGSAPAGVRRCFTAFGFTDEADVFTSRGHKLRVAGPEAHQCVLEALEDCYPYLWPRIKSGDIDSEELDSYIAGHMDLSESARSSARKTLMWLIRHSANEDVVVSLEPTSGRSQSQTNEKPRSKSSGASQPRDVSISPPHQPQVGRGADGTQQESVNLESQTPLDRFSVLAQVLKVNIDSSSTPELVGEVRDLLVTLIGAADKGKT